MGSCVSVHKDSDSAMKLRFSISSKTKKLLIPSPTKQKSVNGEHPIDDFGSKSQSSSPPPVKSLPDFGSKEEAFFDSQPWLDSDCEDFYSVNGDFTPSRGSSRGSTPIHVSSFMGTPQRGKSPFSERASNFGSEPSPTEKKKRLSELFRESIDGGKVSDDQNISGKQNIANGKVEVESTNLDLPSKSINGTPFLSGTNSFSSSERTPNRIPKPEKEKLTKSVKRCLPNFIPSCSSNERKKRLMGPVQNGGG
ncbi:hypothetical protein BVC80_1837g353 [Macleaya cordata]|uniref:Uncharacterized protein n=1 Tax=Macleaya cordata TaxID=56857 RepID=A0A200R479_MACCD|nr:hypothetical protein BVC80_1837g353 [Macleaya cordata]